MKLFKGTSRTTEKNAYTWTEPAAWKSKVLYPYGAENGDVNILTEDVYRQRCKPVSLNGKIGAPFFNQRSQFIYVSKITLTH